MGYKNKSWNINRIYEAFIIDGAKKDELIALYPKSAEIIKPILRGRDIKKYSYEFADKWIIGTFPALKLNIDEYPAIKEHLESYGKRIYQIGETGTRKKTGNKWFETQDQIAYFKEFEKEKIVYPETTQGSYFYFDKDNYFCDKTCFILVGENLKYIQSIISSKLSTYFIRNIAMGLF